LDAELSTPAGSHNSDEGVDAQLLLIANITNEIERLYKILAAQRQLLKRRAIANQLPSDLNLTQALKEGTMAAKLKQQSNGSQPPAHLLGFDKALMMQQEEGMQQAQPHSLVV